MFHAPGSGGLELQTIRRGDGEIGLRAAGGDDRPYFGVIYVGDSPKFLKLVRSEEPALTVGEDAISDALFDGINQRGSPVNVLIGAKRFMEGWNSWRVSSMGLLNIGRSEGSQIIQLFGRGVRLRGKDFCLKRSRALEGTGHPPFLHLLETLQIFAIRASYMEKFRQYLRAEGISEPREFILPFHVRDDLLAEGLLVPRLPRDASYTRSGSAFLFTEGHGKGVRLDLAPRLSGFRSGGGEMAETAEFEAREPIPIPPESLALLDWQRMRLDLLDHARSRGYWNVVVRQADLHAIAACCKLAADERVFEPRMGDDLERLQEAVTQLLRKALDTAWRHQREVWETTYLEYQRLTEDDPNLKPGERAAYTIQVPTDGTEDGFIAELESFVEKGDVLRDPQRQGLRRLRKVELDRHLYEPLLRFEGEDLPLSPPRVVDSEARFVEHLRAFWNAEKDAACAGFSLFLLKNLSRGAGVGFFADCGFYPDFILWLKKGDRQHIVFVEPHGMIHANAYIHDEKARLHERLREEINPAMAERSGRTDVTLDSYIVSATCYDTLRKKYGDGKWDRDKFADHHILFFPDSRDATDFPYLEQIFDDQLRRLIEP